MRDKIAKIIVKHCIKNGIEMFPNPVADEIMQLIKSETSMGDIMEKAWLVWSNEHGCWWGPNNSGYEKKKERAGKYTFEEALKICADANQYSTNIPQETMVQYF